MVSPLCLHCVNLNTLNFFVNFFPFSFFFWLIQGHELQNGLFWSIFTFSGIQNAYPHLLVDLFQGYLRLNYIRPIPERLSKAEADGGRAASNHVLAACIASGGALCRGNTYDRAPVPLSLGWCYRSENGCWPSTSCLLFFGSFGALPTRTRDEEGNLCRFFGARTLGLYPQPVSRPCISSPLQWSGRGATRLAR